MKFDLKAMPAVSTKKGDVKRMRQEGKIPAVLYGHGEKSKAIYIEHQDFKKVLAILKKEAVTINIHI
jgi:ribosomal protein L25 (general stress protein Ctc)